MELFDRSVRLLVENRLLGLFFIVQIGLLVFALWRLSTEENAWHTRTNAWASILTVVGIFGTFLGIFFGLMDFNVEDIEGSIGPLLEGLKLAFLTSVVGIFSSLILKFGSLFQKIGPDAQENPITVLNQIRDSLTGGQSTTHTELRKLKAVVRANHEQLAKLGKEEGDKTRETLKALEDVQKSMLTQLGKLVGEFRAFSKNVAESVAELATEELIGALKNVIENFNTKITEQFGDNFKQLNEAVGRTVEWQEQYRKQMSELIGELGDAADAFKRARDSLEDVAESSRLISERSESIVACAEKLDPILHTLNNQLEAFSKLRKRAQEAIPLIQNSLDELTNDFSASVKAAIEASDKSMANQRDALKTQNDALDEALRRSTQHMIEQVGHLDKNLKEQLKKALGSLADQLTSLSEKFADDYLPLTDELRRVLTIAKGIPPDDDNPS